MSGRPYCVHSGEPDGQEYALIGGGHGGTAVPYTGSLTRHVLETLAFHAHLCLHVTVLAGRDPHHIVEASSRRWPGRCGMRSPSTRGWTGCRAPRAPCESREHDRGARLRVGQPPVGRAGRGPDRARGEVVVTADPEQAAAADGLVVPGVGAFAACMAGLVDVGGPEVIAARIAAGRPTLAICVGHQVLFDTGIEHGVQTAGLRGLARDGRAVARRRLPHMGWNTVTAPPAAPLFRGVGDERFYFVHSYGGPRPAGGARPGDHLGRARRRPVRRRGRGGPVWSTQFHPEKSGDAGARLIANWVATL